MYNCPESNLHLTLMINQQKTWLEFSLTKLVSENKNFLKELENSLDYLTKAENKNFSLKAKRDMVYYLANCSAG